MADPSYIDGGTLLDGEAWVSLFSTTLGSTAASVTFASTADGQVGDFSQYLDLILIAASRGTYTGVGGVTMWAAFNNDTTASHYESQRVYTSGTSTAVSQNLLSGTAMLGASAADGQPTNAFSAIYTRFYDINSGKFKNTTTRSGFLGDGGAGRDYSATILAGWYDVAAIYEIDLTCSADSFKAGSTFDLWGILPRMVTA